MVCGYFETDSKLVQWKQPKIFVLLDTTSCIFMIMADVNAHLNAYLNHREIKLERVSMSSIPFNISV